MDQTDIINLLDSYDTRHEGLNAVREQDDINNEVISKLVECAIRESDPSYNGEYIKECIKHRSIHDISNLLLEKVVNGKKIEKIGALKALYHVRENRIITNFDNGTFYENPKYKNNKIEYKKRLNILKSEFVNCDNIVIKFFYQWAIPSEKGGILNGLPETDVDLIEKIKEDKELVALWNDSKKWK